MKKVFWFVTLVLVCQSGTALAFDQSHALWDKLLHQHVVWVRDGVASEVDYKGFKADEALLKQYEQQLSSVSKQDFDGWDKNDRIAFLINAYNAFTVQLILNHYGTIDSIKDIGHFWQSPWKQDFFTLLGKKHSLDDIEQGMLRAPGRYNEPRIHFAVNCASIGCPALRPEAYVGDKLDQQLNDQMHRFLSDKTRNRYDPKLGDLEVSKIFDWYGDDFAAKWGSVAGFFAAHADIMTADPQYQRKIRDKKVPVYFLDYDWKLNSRHLPHKDKGKPLPFS